MIAFEITLIVWLVLLLSGVSLYYVYVYVLPVRLTDKLKGWKTKVFGVVLAASPELIQLLSFIQVISADWEPSDNSKFILRGVGVAITALRFITDKEST